MCVCKQISSPQNGCHDQEHDELLCPLPTPGLLPAMNDDDGDDVGDDVGDEVGHINVDEDCDDMTLMKRLTIGG